MRLRGNGAIDAPLFPWPRTARSGPTRTCGGEYESCHFTNVEHRRSCVAPMSIDGRMWQPFSPLAETASAGARRGQGEFYAVAMCSPRRTPKACRGWSSCMATGCASIPPPSARRRPPRAHRNLRIEVQITCLPTSLWPNSGCCSRPTRSIRRAQSRNCSMLPNALPAISPCNCASPSTRRWCRAWRAPSPMRAGCRIRAPRSSISPTGWRALPDCAHWHGYRAVNAAAWGHGRGGKSTEKPS